ncbi:hypothetical protein FB567DRAFT_519470 [Paraphoma chrysanthemicola]|uniref:Uncharacterized protein n=1 Tax=Paraphoma chrysanthemicola TaxID=798071 RepID=A0A8K0RAR0_9PLEO|nr:hypothetical protein FB567DRAFT_519470 [Paraphoma chrysanthemicola]
MPPPEHNKVLGIAASDREDAARIDEIAAKRGWFRPEENSPFYPIIQDYLAEKLTLDEATNKLCTPIDEKINAQRLDDVNFLDLWYSFLHSARRINFRERNWLTVLVDLVKSFKAHSVPGNEKYNYLYSSLTDFGMASREAHNDAPEPGRATHVEITTWANLNAFWALITGEEVFDLSLYAIWAMRDALEEDHPDDRDSTAAQKYDAYVPAAAVWATGAFRLLFEKEQDLTPTDDKQGNPARGGWLWKGKAEFSKERWYFWRERFAMVAERKDVTEETRIVAKDAIAAMERAATFEKI